MPVSACVKLGRQATRLPVVRTVSRVENIDGDHPNHGIMTLQAAPLRPVILHLVNAWGIEHDGLHPAERVMERFDDGGPSLEGNHGGILRP